MHNKTILITGAGFSAPAQLPIQDKILEEMMEAPNIDFMSAEPSRESIKFLVAYIKVTLYLLNEYGNSDMQCYEKEFIELNSAFQADNRVADVLNYIQNTYNDIAQIKDFNINKVLDDVADKYIIEQDKYSLSLVRLKEKLRNLLDQKKIVISLEDVFTAFDKSISMRENTKNYTYSQMDSLQHSVLRLFTYYFSKKTNEHNFSCEDYEEVIKFLKVNIVNTSVITTNWDVLLEKYMVKNNLKYDYGFNSKYVIDGNSNNSTVSRKEEDGVYFLKVHGSINWFRCLRCGTLQVCDTDECGQYLFDDLKEEKCNQCGQVSYGSRVQLKPEIITPTMLKSINSQLYNNLWKNVAYELQNAERIIFAVIHYQLQILNLGIY